jgi:hypothetical protein
VLNVASLQQQGYQRRNYADSYSMSGTTGKTSNSGLAQPPPSLASHEDFRISANVNPVPCLQVIQDQAVMDWGKATEKRAICFMHAG